MSLAHQFSFIIAIGDRGENTSNPSKHLKYLIHLLLIVTPIK